MKKRFSPALTPTRVLALLCIGLLGSACTGDDSAAAGADASTGDSTAAPTPDASTSDSGFVPPVDSGAHDASNPPDAGADAALPTPVFVARTSVLTEGLWEVSPGATEGIGTTGAPIVGSVLGAELLAVAPDGGTAAFGTAFADGGAASATYTLGVTTDANGSVYYAVAAAGASPVPSPGIYKLPPNGGVGVPFALGSSVTPAMNFANGLDFIGARLFVADSEGVIYAIDSSGTATVWSQDPTLAPNPTASSTSPACGFVPLTIGANGIVHDAKNVYVTNTDYGRLIAIPIAADGSAGTPSVLKEDCASLAGADGLVMDEDGSFVVAVNAQDKIVRVTPSGQVTVLAAGPPLATPGSVLFDTGGAGGGRRLLVTNTMFFSSADAGLSPGLLEMVIP